MSPLTSDAGDPARGQPHVSMDWICFSALGTSMETPALVSSLHSYDRNPSPPPPWSHNHTPDSGCQALLAPPPPSWRGAVLQDSNPSFLEAVLSLGGW